MAILSYQHTPVFPFPEGAEGKGIRLREYVATMALQAVIAGQQQFTSRTSPEDAAKQAIAFADEFLKQLHATQEGAQ
jgi:hypothetical protein